MASNGLSSNSTINDNAVLGEESLSHLQDLASPSKADKSLFAQLSGNPFFTAGFGLAGIGAAAAIVQRGARHGASLLRRRLLVDVEINAKDESYQWFLHWMTKHQRLHISAIANQKAGIKRLGAQGQRTGFVESMLQRFTPGLRHLSIETEKTSLPNGSVQTQFSLVPGPGKHVIRFKNAFLLVERVRETKSMDIIHGKPWETVTLTTLYSHRHVFEDIFLEAHSLAKRATEGKTVIYHPQSTSWETFGEPRRKRTLESVILDEGIKERIVGDVQDFIKSASWYNDRGVPYRRGYLLHGPPGSGKTSFVQALAGELDYNIAILNLSERGLTDDRLQYLLTVVPKRTLVLLEDADAAFSTRRMQSNADGYHGANVTFSGLLNALDGVGSAEERIIFLTTNHVERLDAALIRPGRVDMTVRLGDVTAWQVGQFWDRFYGELDPERKWRSRFLQRLMDLQIIEKDVDGGLGIEPTYPTSTAALQGLFLYSKGDMQGAINMATGLLPDGAQVPPGNTRNKRDSSSKRTASSMK